MGRHCLLLVAVLFLGCRDAAEVEVDSGPPPPVSTDFARLPEVLASIQKTGEVLLYEGLPSEFWEPQLREQELRQKETLDLHGYAVYEERITLPGPDARQLTSLMSAKESYQPYNNRKKCGGFSADYCVEWTTGESTTQILIGLECGEVKIFSPQSELYCDVTAQASQKLKQLLSSYQKNFPATAQKESRQ